MKNESPYFSDFIFLYTGFWGCKSGGGNFNELSFTCQSGDSYFFEFIYILY